ncbi:MAG: Clp1/GlmU family protein [Planctomycetota bacterium]|jgi:polynucleotide 5'-hydroxyl-kinase GRC3/NOL9
MADDWADKIAQQLIGQGLMQEGICLVLGTADTGKTTLVESIAGHTASSQPVAVVDADIGQSHIGPPTTVGWALVDNPQVNLSQLAANGISFVGDVTPVGHLLQLTAAIAQCVRQAAEVAASVIVDTPGLVHGPAACALWWTVQRMLQPESILAVQRGDELNDVISGLQHLNLRLEPIQSPPQIPSKSPQRRRGYRQKQFQSYFQDSHLYSISLSDISIQYGRLLSPASLVHRLVALRNDKGKDIAIALIEDWQDSKKTAVVRAPQLDIRQIRCLVIGDVSIEIA